MLRPLLIALSFSLLPGHLFAQPAAETGFVISAEIETEFLAAFEAELICDSGAPQRSKFSLQHGESNQLLLRAVNDNKTLCRVRALLPDGYSATYTQDGTGNGVVDENGCRYDRVKAGQSYACHIVASQDPVELTVYLKWIGGADEAGDVEVSLECESGEYSGARFVNQDSPASWEISRISPDGILCNVSEKVRETFRPDIIDCQGLYVLPGKGEGCVLINTRIVKRIEMFNRYGKIVMIVLVLGVGLLAVKRLS